MLEHFYYTKLTFILECEETVRLQNYKGSALRGGFGQVFRKIACVTGENNCKACTYKQQCPFAYVFCSLVDADEGMRAAASNAPMPFVIEPPMAGKNIFNPGDILEFGLVLIGKGIDYLPYFLYSFEELGRLGLGKDCGRYRLLSVSCDDGGTTLYAGGRYLAEHLKIAYCGNKEAASAGAVRMIFRTPFRVRAEGRVSKDLSFELIMRNVFRRLNMLSYFHCGKELDMRFEGWIERAGKVRMAEQRLSFYDWERISGRTHQRIKMGGYIGDMVFQGDLGEFLPFLKLGEVVHIGKGCSFGMGKYNLSDRLTPGGF